jgi:plasmid stabilization system protein ParE
VVEKDINTLHTYPRDRSYVFSKNRAIRCLDDIATQVTSLFENTYIGKVDNNASGRTLFKGDIIQYLTRLESANAIQNLDSTADVEVLPGGDIESVVVNLGVQPVDAMEKLYMTVVVS